MGLAECVECSVECAVSLCARVLVCGASCQPDPSAQSEVSPAATHLADELQSRRLQMSDTRRYWRPSWWAFPFPSPACSLTSRHTLQRGALRALESLRCHSQWELLAGTGGGR